MKQWIYLTIAVLGLTACNAGPNQTNIEVITNMMDQTSIKSQDWVPAEGDKVQMRQPPVNTVARGHVPYAFATDGAGAAKQPNPFGSDTSPEFLTVGRQQYDIYCALCHGVTGAGEGQIAAKMAVKPRIFFCPKPRLIAMAAFIMRSPRAWE